MKEDSGGLAESQVTERKNGDGQFVYEDYTGQTRAGQEFQVQVDAYLKSEELLTEAHVFVNIGYDAEQIENFLLFPENLRKLDSEKRELVTKALQESLLFNATVRKRDWQIVYFGFDDDTSEGALKYLDQEQLIQAVEPNTGTPYFKGIVQLFTPRRKASLSNFFGLLGLKNDQHVRYYPAAWAYMMAEKLIDTRHVQQMISGLDPDYTKRFHAERRVTRAADDSKISE